MIRPLCFCPAKGGISAYWALNLELACFMALSTQAPIMT